METPKQESPQSNGGEFDVSKKAAKKAAKKAEKAGKKLEQLAMRSKEAANKAKESKPKEDTPIDNPESIFIEGFLRKVPYIRKSHVQCARDFHRS